MPAILVIDDDRSVLHLVSQAFQNSSIGVHTADSAEKGLGIVRQHHPDTVLLDLMLPGNSGLQMLRQIHQLDAKLPVMLITGNGSSDMAIEAMKLGAYDYILKPLQVQKLQELVRHALETRRLMHVKVALAPGVSNHDEGELLVGRSPRMLDVFKAIGRVSSQNVTVLIRGESGTGKELIARAIYQHSPRAHGPFLAVNCAAIPDSLLESELFGHERGSFTGADSRRIGKFEQCSRGTIFLDEVGDMSPLVQSKILRLLQEQRFERVGGNHTIQTDVRILAATNRDLEKMVQQGTFRSDLYYRLNGFTIELPSLNERTSDIPLLLEHFLSRFRRELNLRDIEGISPDAVEMFMDYAWPGNIRELQGLLKQALLTATGPVIVPEFLPDELKHGHHLNPTRTSNGQPHIHSDLKDFLDSRLQNETTNLYAESLEMMERYILTRVLRLTAGNQSKSAQLLGITRGSLRNKIRTLGISIDQVVTVGEEAGPD
jgi:two-component system nitrogen regulation response regulator GlnG